MHVFLDTNILIDIFSKRVTSSEEEAIILQNILDGKIEASISALSIPYIKYICRKDTTDEECRKFLLSLIEFVTIVDINSSKLISALERSNFYDFEDCLQDECAKDIHADYIITRNKEDYVLSYVKAVTPREFLQNCTLRLI